MPIRGNPSRVLLPVLLIGAGAPFAGELTIDQRIEAQRAIERVYYRHQDGTTLPFERAVPAQLLEKKVRLYLKQSAALEKLWKTRITAEALRRETERIAQDTRMPERLRELYAALGNDPVLIQECLVRPVLADRLARQCFSHDRRIHAESRRAAKDLLGRLARGDLSAAEEHPLRRVDEFRIGDQEPPDPQDVEGQRTIALSAEQLERIRGSAAAAPGEIEEEQAEFVIRVLLEEESDWLRVATYTVAKVSWDEWWASVEKRFDENAVRTVASSRAPLVEPTGQGTEVWDSAVAGAHSGMIETAELTQVCQPANRWRDELMGTPPAGRSSFSSRAFWTGGVMLVWGMDATGLYVGTGGRYDPLTDTWRPTTTLNWPSSATGPAVWAGNLMLVYGRTGAGAKYDPLADTWAPMSMQGMPSQGRRSAAAVWTGTRMIVWGGTADGVAGLDTGGIYNPESDMWSPTSTAAAPEGRLNPVAVWTGTRMFVWGGLASADVYLNTGGMFDPANDSWSPMSTLNAPQGRSSAQAVWTGSRVVVWGGATSSAVLNTGGRYNPSTNTWSPTTTVAAPTARLGHAAVWTGSRMVVWGGGTSEPGTNTGGSYDPVADAWQPISTVGAPVARFGPLFVWTGDSMLVWGGTGAAVVGTQLLVSGGRYDPQANTWTAMTEGDAPSARHSHTAVWTGSRMIVWGGWHLQNSGGQYDPTLDHWTPTSLTNAPLGREGATAVWTGQVMIVWGGSFDVFSTTGTGGRYDPIAEMWSPTSPIGAPQQRYRHTAVWTGNRMLVWGGNSDGQGGNLNTGGSYDPLADTWSPLSTANAPAPRQLHTAIWTGSRMIVWGGGPSVGNTGGRYDPASDSWLATSTTSAPAARAGHTAIWTGSRMIVWGGNSLGDGALYDPEQDQWSPTSMVGSPSPRSGHTAVWMSDVMLIWGVVTGGRYDPVSDTWATIPDSFNAPAARTKHTAVAVGNRMIVWGGIADGDGGVSRRGGHYEFTPALPDDDLDGAPAICDCDDQQAAVFPGAPQVCFDGLNNDCTDAGWPSLAGTNDLDDDGDGMSECGGDCDDAHASVLPGGMEISCDGLNNDCSDPGWPALPPSELQDADADGVLCGGDCDDADPAVWATPGEVPDFGFVGASLLAWSAPGQPGGEAIVYDTIRSGAAGDFLSVAACVESDDGSDTAATDAELPALGSVLYYLVRAQNSCPAGQGSVGSGSDNMPRAARACP